MSFSDDLNTEVWSDLTLSYGPATDTSHYLCEQLTEVEALREGAREIF
jgi:hypothetical protein